MPRHKAVAFPSVPTSFTLYKVPTTVIYIPSK
jgi:hypothetical protein